MRPINKFWTQNHPFGWAVKTCMCSISPWWLSEMILLWKDLVPIKVQLTQRSIWNLQNISSELMCLFQVQPLLINPNKQPKGIQITAPRSQALIPKKGNPHGRKKERGDWWLKKKPRNSTSARFFFSLSILHISWAQAVKFSNQPHVVCIIGNNDFSEWL